MTKNQRTRARKAEAKHREKTLLASEIPEDLPDNLREARTITSRGEISSYITFSEQGKCLLCKDGECGGGTILVIGDQAIAPLVKAEPHREADEKSCGLQMDYIVTPNMSISDLTIMLDQVFNASTESQILGPAEDYTCCRGHFSDRFTDVILSFTVAYESAQVKDATGEFLNSLGQLALSLKTYLPHVDPSCLHILSPILRPNLTPTGWSSYTSSNQYISQLNQTRTHSSLPNLPGLFQEDDLIMTGWEETDQDGMNTEGPLPTMNLFNPKCLLKSDWSSTDTGGVPKFQLFTPEPATMRPKELRFAFTNRIFSHETAKNFRQKIIDRVQLIIEDRARLEYELELSVPWEFTPIIISKACKITPPPERCTVCWIPKPSTTSMNSDQPQQENMFNDTTQSVFFCPEINSTNVNTETEVGIVTKPDNDGDEAMPGKEPVLAGNVRSVTTDRTTSMTGATSNVNDETPGGMTEDSDTHFGIIVDGTNREVTDDFGDINLNDNRDKRPVENDGGDEITVENDNDEEDTDKTVEEDDEKDDIDKDTPKDSDTGENDSDTDAARLARAQELTKLNLEEMDTD